MVSPSIPGIHATGIYSLHLMCSNPRVTAVRDPYTRFYLNYRSQKKEVRVYAIVACVIALWITAENHFFGAVCFMAAAEYATGLFSLHNNLSHLSFEDFVNRYQYEIKAHRNPLFTRYRQLVCFPYNSKNIQKLEKFSPFQMTIRLVKFVDLAYTDDFRAFGYDKMLSR